MTHASDAWLALGYDASRSGKATFTIERSSAAMKAPSAVTPNTTDARGPSLGTAPSAIANSLVRCVIELTLGRAYARAFAPAVSAESPPAGCARSRLRLRPVRARPSHL